MDGFDEAFGDDGRPRPLYAPLIEALEDEDLERLARGAREAAAARGMDFGDGAPIEVDPVPRLIGADEWSRLETGLRQRAAALGEFLLDAYAERRIFELGLVPAKLLESSPSYEPAMRGLLGEGPPPVLVAGFDLVRDASGEFLVLEDNVRMPSGAAYATALRGVVSGLVDSAPAPRPVDRYPRLLGAALAAAAGEGEVAILSEGASGSAWFEHEELAGQLGVPLLTPDRLETANGSLCFRDDQGRHRLAVLYRRLDQERLTEADGSPNPLGELLLPALRSGAVRCLNPFGAGIADDKLAHAYVEEMIRFYLDEEPLLRSVKTFAIGDDDGSASLEQLDEMVVKARDSFGGAGVTLMPLAGCEQRRAACEEVRKSPHRFVAQRVVPLSTHPTVRDGRLHPRRVDLRPFVVSSARGALAMPGGLTRFAPGAGDMVVNSSRGGGCKDTWVVDR